MINTQKATMCLIINLMSYVVRFCYWMLAVSLLNNSMLYKNMIYIHRRRDFAIFLNAN